MNHKEYTDTILALGASQGDQVAWAEMVRLHRPLVHSLVIRFARGEPDMSEDIEQDAWTSITAKIKEYNFTHCAMSTWIKQVTMSAIQNGWRHRKNERDSETCLCNTDDTPSDEDLPDELAARSEKAAMVKRAIDLMPTNQKRAATLVFIHGKGLIETARLMGVSKQRIHQMLYLGSERELSAAETIELVLPSDVD